MALAFDAVGPSAAGASGTTASLAWSHTVTGSSNVLLAGVACDVDATTITGVTYGAASMTGLFAGAANYIHCNGQTAGWLAVFRLLNATAGTATITVTLSGASQAEGGSLSFTGADTTALGTVITGTGASATPSLAVTPNTSGNLIAAFLGQGAFISSATSPLTSRFINNAGGANAGGHAGGATAPATGSSVTAAWAVTADWYSIIAAEVQAGGGASVPAVLAPGAGAALNATIQTSTISVGPRYAGTATDLGGNQGVWGTPNFATGGP